MTLVQLQYIVALDIYRSFVAAAAHCNVSQPALTTQIKRLETELGVTLFDRSKKPVIPTDIGSLIIEQAQKILQESQKVKDSIQAYQGDLSGEIRLGIIPTVAPYVIPFFAQSFNKKYPMIRLAIYEESTEQIIHALKNGLLDAGIYATPIENTRLRSFPLFYEEFLVYVSAQHPLFDSEHIQVRDIEADQLLLLKEGNCFRNQMINICDQEIANGVPRPFFYQSNSIESLKRVVESRQGLTIIPELAARLVPDERASWIKSFQSFRPVREISLVVSRVFLKKHMIQKLVDEIKSKIPADMQDIRDGQLIHPDIEA